MLMYRVLGTPVSGWMSAVQEDYQSTKNAQFSHGMLMHTAPISLRTYHLLHYDRNIDRHHERHCTYAVHPVPHCSGSVLADLRMESF